MRGVYLSVQVIGNIWVQIVGVKIFFFSCEWVMAMAID
jgi:hypothetical protein